MVENTAGRKGKPILKTEKLKIVKKAKLVSIYSHDPLDRFCTFPPNLGIIIAIHTLLPTNTPPTCTQILLT